jgi:hypothetical protein
MGKRSRQRGIAVCIAITRAPMQPATNMNGLSRVILQWEGAKYVVETTPAKPYTGSIEDLLSVQANMRKRYGISTSLRIEY